MSEETESSKEQDLYAQRLEKAGKWRALGLDPYGNGFRPTDLAGEIVRRHGGDIGLRARAGGGAEAWVTLPLSTRAS